MADTKYEFIIDYDNKSTAAYYYISNDPHKIVFLEDNDKPIGLYRKDNEEYVYEFNYEVICTNGLDLNLINKGNCDDYLFKIIDTCCSCCASRTTDYANEEGVCDCWCSKCGELFRDCDCYRL